jgi:hypothetical protein
MTLPTRVTPDDVHAVCSYLATKATGATPKELEAVVDKKHLDPRKLTAVKGWGLIEDTEGRWKITPLGREFVRSDANRVEVISTIIRRVPPYLGMIERVAHRHEDSVTTTDVAAHWHDHFKGSVGNTDGILNAQALVFLQLAAGALLGTLIVGRRGQPTRFGFNAEAVTRFLSTAPPPEQEEGAGGGGRPTPDTDEPEQRAPLPALPPAGASTLGQAIFIAHGKNKKPLEQLKQVLDQFKIPYRVAVEEPNLGRPISAKVRDVMKSCNCAILIFTADEEFKDKKGDTIWRPSENVVNELGATAFLYDNRIVIMKEEGVTFPTNFRDIGYISFQRDQLDAKALDIIKEMIGFGIVRVST